MKMIQEFKAFAMRGNVMDLAIAVIIGGAFGKIVTSFVNDLLMPPIGMLLGGIDFKEFKLLLKPAEGDIAAVTWNYGMFIQSTIDFLIVAFAIFMMIKAIMSFKRKEEAPAEAPVPPAPTKEESLLTEIRDILKSK